MSKVIAGELSGGAISRAISILENEVADTNNLKLAINSFITGTTSTLKGPAYDAARAKIETYISVLDTRANLASTLASAISSATTTMSNYMEGYSELDDAKLPEIEAEINSIKASIDQLFLSSNNSTGKDTQDYGSLIASYEAQLEELEKLRDKLSGLAGADASAYGQINSTNSNIASYSSGIASTNASSISI